jgi:hypothetical protein
MITIVLVVSACANRVIPSGGPVDKNEPFLTQESPPSGTTNFTGKKIEISFNEFIQLKDGGKALAVSPPMEPAPVVTALKRTIVLELPDTLEPQTTYTFDFGDAISDVNETNPVRGYRYVFSTGPVIDTLQMTGKIINALTLKPESGALAVVFPENIADTVLGFTGPSYFARAGEDGSFAITNMRPGNYRVFGLADKNNNLRANLPDEELGFINGTVSPGVSDLEIRLSKHAPLQQRVLTSLLAEPGRAQIVLARPSDATGFTFLPPVPDQVIPFYNTAGDSLTLIFLPRADSAQVVMTDEGIPYDTLKLRLTRGSNQALSTVTIMDWQTTPAQGGVLDPGQQPSVSWSVPLTRFDASKVMVTRDTVPVEVTVSQPDSLKRRVTVTGTWPEGKYTVTFLPEAATDLFDRKNDTLRFTFIIPDERSRGSLSYVLTPVAESRIIQLVNEKDEVKKQHAVPADGRGRFERMEPGVYRMRLIFDTNNNGRWDEGDFRKKRNPEQVYYHPDTITIRANWELEFDWQLP